MLALRPLARTSLRARLPVTTATAKAFSTTPARLETTPGEVAQATKDWIREMTSRPAQIDKEVLDSTKAEQLVRSLPTRGTAGGSAVANDDAPGTVGKAHHWVYFTPTQWLSELAPDGTSAEYNAPPPFKRRMWAGGSIQWRPSSPLRLGVETEQSVVIPKIEHKGDMMFVFQEREYRQPGSDEWLVKEGRSHVFLPGEGKNKSTEKTGKGKKSAPLPTPDFTHTYTPSTPLLFRYSGLTWNAHKIHYDLEWTRTVEGHPDLVVHGPLTATLLVELAGMAARDVAAELVRFDYRATSPMYVNKPISLNAAWDGPRGGKLTLWAEQEGRVGMKATAELKGAM